MKAETKKKWVKALRSGEYNQIRGQMVEQKKDKSVVGYCCLGVLAYGVLGCDLESHDTGNDDGEYKTFLNERLPSSVIRKESGTVYTHATLLYHMNDFDKKNFNEIADYIEKNVPAD